MDRRLGVVVFTDLVRSTETFRRMGADEAHRVRSAHVANITRVVEAADGELVKTMGDGVMAVFGLASPALEFAGAAQREFSSADSEPLAGLRIGISVGELMPDIGDYHGDAVAEAARLCQAAKPGQVLCSIGVRAVIGGEAARTLRPVGPLSLRGIGDAIEADELIWQKPANASLRVVLADDAVVLRHGIARLLEDEGFRVVAQAGDATALLALVEELLPDVVITDIRMPPAMSLDGLEAAVSIRARFPEIGILVLSQHVEAEYALRLLLDDARGVGYLLKERITAVEEFIDAVRRIAAGGSAVDKEVVDALMSGGGTAPDELGGLSEREREVLGLMAEGLSNPGIADRLFVSQRTVESHVASIFTKLGIPPEREEDRRVVAVVRYLKARP